METERLSERILSGLANASRKGIRLGRPPGSVLSNQHLLQSYPGVVKDLKACLSIRQTAAFRELSKDTIQRIKKAITQAQTS